MEVNSLKAVAILVAGGILAAIIMHYASPFVSQIEAKVGGVTTS